MRTWNGARSHQLVIAGLAATVIAGCGGDHQLAPAAGASPGMATLLGHVLGDADLVTAFDLGAARTQLGLSARLAPAAPGGARGAARTFDVAALAALPYLNQRKLPAAARAIDHGRVTAAIHATFGAINGHPETVVLLATDQPPVEIQRGLRSGGWKRGGDGAYVRRAPRGEPKVFTNVAFGDGFVVASDDRIQATLAADRENVFADRFAPQRRLIESLRGALRIVYAPNPGETPLCELMIAGGQRLDARGAEDLVLTLETRPDPKRVLIGKDGPRISPTLRDYRVRAATVTGHDLRLRIAAAPGAPATSTATRLIIQTRRSESLYNCPGGYFG